MQREELLEATASERLTEAEELENCHSWHADEQKATFILLDASGKLVGDVNLFLNDPDDAACAEIEVMVAEESARRGGVASESLRLLQTWAAGALGLRRFVAKVGLANAPSAALFRRLCYEQVSISTVFQEETLELRLPEEGVREAYEALLIRPVASAWTS